MVFEETQAESYRMLRTGLASGSGTAASIKQRKRRKKEGEEVDGYKRVRRWKADNEDCQVVQIFIKMDGYRTITMEGGDERQSQ